MMSALRKRVAEVLGHALPPCLGVAVSGGGDSVALLAVLVAFARDHDIDLHAITIDHGVRAGAQSEIDLVAELCKGWKVPHHVARWTGWQGEGNFQAEARSARYALMAEWAEAQDIKHIALGHTADDQAETFLMRLARGAGVDGLSAMAPRRVDRGITWLRPFLETERATLRSFLRAEEVRWCEDPSNENRDYQRIRARDALKALAPLDITVSGLVQVSQNMAKAREALRWQAFIAARDIVTCRDGIIAFDRRGFHALPEEIERRLIAHSVQWVSGSPYGPRGPAVARTLASARDGASSTLDGCQVMPREGVLWVFREFNAVRDLSAGLGEIWDNRWRVTGPARQGHSVAVRALGPDGIDRLADWRASGLPREALASTPSVWDGAEMRAAPVAKSDPDWHATLEYGADAYFAALLSH